jgi:hypothetical protein
MLAASITPGLSPSGFTTASAAGVGGVHVHWSSIEAPKSRADLERIGEAVGDAVELRLQRKGRLPRTPVT